MWQSDVSRVLKKHGLGEHFYLFLKKYDRYEDNFFCIVILKTIEF